MKRLTKVDIEQYQKEKVLRLKELVYKETGINLTFHEVLDLYLNRPVNVKANWRRRRNLCVIENEQKS